MPDCAYLRPKTLHYIGGEFCEASLGGAFETVHPASGETLSQVASGTTEDIDRAVMVAKEAFGSWSQTSVAHRADLLGRVAQLIEKNCDSLAMLESLDTGKPLSETLHGDIPRAAANFRFFSDLLHQEEPMRFSSPDGSVHVATREPLGVCGLITPWNLPIYLASWKIAPALAMGNTIVLKPAELTPLSASALAEILAEAGLPAGVFNVVHGYGPEAAGEALVRHPDVDSISFTGETSTGQAIMAAAASTLKKVSFELGGKGASVIFADADLDQALPVACKAAFRNQGQICLAGSRLIVEESIADQCVERIKNQMNQIKVGNPLDQATTMGALISREHRDRVASYVDIARDEGGRVVAGGFIPSDLPERGSYYAPTLITGLKQTSRLIQEEVFGPVLTVQTFKDRSDAVAKLNGTRYGLSCSIWSSDPTQLEEVSRAARMGLVWQNSWFLRNLNTPFGGMKASGIGREGGTYSFNFFSEQKTISSPGS